MIPESLRENPLVALLDGVATAAGFAYGELTIDVDRGNIVEALARLKAQKFERLSAVTAVDRYPAEPRFEIVYHMQSIERNLRLRLKARVSGENPEIETACGVYRSANWYEREVFDLFGVRFLHHPDMRRIMMPDDWSGYPLRKDYPVTGTRY